MENDQKEFRQQEQEQEVQSSQKENEMLNDRDCFLELIDFLRKIVDQGRKIPMTRWTVIDDVDFMAAINQIDANLPNAIQLSIKIAEEEKRILGAAENAAHICITSAEMKARHRLEEASSKAEEILRDAEAQADAILKDTEGQVEWMLKEAEDRRALLVNQQGIVQTAKDEATRIVSSAKTDANEIRLKAKHDAQSIIEQVDDQVKEAYRRIQTLRNQMSEGEQ